MNTDILKFARMIDDANYIVFFGGAGVSTERPDHVAALRQVAPSSAKPWSSRP